MPIHVFLVLVLGAGAAAAVTVAAAASVLGPQALAALLPVTVLAALALHWHRR